MAQLTDQHAWNLDDLFAAANDPALKQSFDEADKLITDLKQYRGKIASLSQDELLKLITTEEELAILFHKIGLYAGLLESTHVNNPDVTRFVKKIEEQLVLKGQEIVFIDVEMAQLTEEKWQAFLSADVLKPYHKHLEEIHRQAKHVLSEPEEKILAEKSQTGWQTLSHLYSVTTNTLEFAWDDKKVTLEEILTAMRDPKPEVRKKAAMTLHDGLKTNDKTTPPIYNALVQDKSINDRLRHFDYPEESRYLSEDVDKATVEALITAVNKSFDLVRRYYTLKKQILKADALFWWDLYAPLPQTTTKIEADAAKTMVIDTFTHFSPEVGEIAKKMFASHHVDWLPSPTKQGGAFCAYGGKGVYPYILLNYTETLRDVMTVAHEMGHAVHDVLADANNVFLQTHPSLALAEIASVFSESLLFEKLMQSDISQQDKMSLLMAHIEDSFATVHRQTTMFQFEQQVHARRAKEGELSQEQLNELWFTTMKQPYEPSITYTEEHKNTWMYIPHIINSPFYVFSYSFAQLCVLALFKQYKEQGEAFVPTYLSLLKSGGSRSPKDTLALAGLDITQPTFWQQGLSIIGEYIDQLEKMIS